ncbi:MAG: N-acetylglucosamine-6-phosphate deacetylase [Oscillospiraceae bacterium]|nr:N-acetylglucosamine-6-phosphate deacetylase [Oscillospiraceae bacterium]
MIVTNGILFCDDGVFRKTDIEIQNRTVTAIGDEIASAGQEILDADGCYVVPGLVDIHIHGAAGADFSDGTPQSIQEISRFLLKHGTTSFLGTSMALPEEQLAGIYETACPFVGKMVPGQAVLQGIHMEGPFFNQDKRGAQNEKYIINADFDMFTRLYTASGSNIRMVAIAPEVEGGLDFIGKAHSLCSVSLGHSCADYDTAGLAFARGANHVTHLFNGMSAFGHRDPGIIGAAADSGAYVEIICDGIHLHPATVRSVFKLFGDNKVCLISDAMRACGMPAGRYDLGGQLVTVKDGSATIAGGSLAGSVAVLADCLRQAVKFGIPLECALKAATINPAKSVGLDDKTGSLSKGKRADILVFDRDLALNNVIFDGVLQVGLL